MNENNIKAGNNIMTDVKYNKGEGDYCGKCKDNISNLPKVTELGDGLYGGIMSGYVFTYDGKKYECSFGVRGFNIPLIVKVEGGVDSRG